MNEFGIYLKPVTHVPASIRGRVERMLVERERAAAREIGSLTRQLQQRKSTYRRELAELLGRSNWRKYRQLRAELSKAPRARRLRESRKLLESIDFDRVRADELRKEFLRERHRLLAVPHRAVAPLHVPPLDDCSPWVTYTAPYDGYFWSYAWTRSDEADDPVLARYLDTANGHIGSSIRTRLSGADDDDFVTVDYYTSLNVWHTALATGVLEGYIAFEFNASPYSGEVKDEFGLSSATFTQWARARLRAVDPAGGSEIQESRVFNYIDTAWGDDVSWNNYVSAPRDLHWYFFRTTIPFEQGRAILLEAGIDHMTWFTADDESITTADNLDLRLHQIMVRSCPGPIIL